MNKLIYLAVLLLLAACKTAPSLEDDARYIKMARVVDVHVYTEAERKEAKAQLPSDVRVGGGLSVGVGSGGFGFGGLMLGMGTSVGDHQQDKNTPPQVAYGATRYTVVTMDKAERFELNSYAHFQIGDCVKVLMGHPTEYARLYTLRSGEHCE
ncbi:MAG: hypothetical protein ACOH1I_11130 [Gallionellaceae bacterium]|jgi:hypothetical protein